MRETVQKGAEHGEDGIDRYSLKKHLALGIFPPLLATLRIEAAPWIDDGGRQRLTQT
jgi:hypothetical protein